MTTAQDQLRDLLRVHVAPVLRADGYAGSGQSFHRVIDDNWAAVSVQRDRYSTADTLRFTVNLGTASTVVREEDGYPRDEPAAEVDCHWRTRIGGLLPGGRDTWWSVGAPMTAVEVGVLGETVARHLAGVALPRLAAMASDEAILGTYLHGEPAPGMAPATMDVVGPILRRLGPPERLARYLEVIDGDGKRAASLYAMFDDHPPTALGPARIATRMERLSSARLEPRQQAIMDLGYAPPTDTVRAVIRPFLDDPNRHIRSAAAQALGRLGDTSVVPRLEAMVRDDPARRTAVHAAFALARLDGALDTGERTRIREAIEARRARAVGHDRAALSELLRTLHDI